MKIFLNENELFVGRKVRVNLKINPDPTIYEDVYLPVVIIAEYPRFFVCEVLPHINPKRSWGESKPYRITIDKFLLQNREIFVKMF